MKKDIHPTYYPKAKVKCVCGAVHTFGDTKEAMQVEICGNCHPFYTGTQQLVDTTGRVERYHARQARATPEKAKKVRVKKEKVQKTSS